MMSSAWMDPLPPPVNGEGDSPNKVCFVDAGDLGH